MTRRTKACRTKGRDERGAIFVFSVMILSALMLVASFVVDLGIDRIVRTDMQSLSDTTALDMATILNGSQTTSQILASSTYASTKAATLARNAGSTAVSVDPDDVEITFGMADSNGAWLRGAGPADRPNAVKVSASGSSSIRLWPGEDPARPRRSAIAVQLPPQVCLAAGASLADLSPGGALDVLLGKLIGINRLSLVSPAGVASLSAQVPLLDLAAELGVGSVEELAAIPNVSALGFVNAMADVLTADGSVAAATVLRDIALKLDASTNISVADILAVGTGNGAAADLGLDAFSLVQAVIQAANGDHFVDIGAPVTVPGLTSTKVGVKVISPPMNACGPKGTKARSAQISLKITSGITVLGGLVAEAALDPLEVTIADGWATIGDITCTAAGGTVSATADTAVARLKLNLSVWLLLHLTKVALAVPDLALSPEGASIASSTTQTKTFTYGLAGVPAGQTFGSGVGGTLGLKNITPLKATIAAGLNVPLGGLLNPVLVPLLGLIDPLVTPLLNGLLVPLGLDLGTLQVTPTGRPVCNLAALRK